MSATIGYGLLALAAICCGCFLIHCMYIAVDNWVYAPTRKLIGVLCWIGGLGFLVVGLGQCTQTIIAGANP